MPTLRTIFPTILPNMTNVSTSNVHCLLDFHSKFAQYYPSVKIAPPPASYTYEPLYSQPCINL